MRPKKFVIIQRVCQKYRVPIFEKLANTQDINFQLIYGDDLPNTKTKTSGNLTNFESVKIRTIHFKLFNYIFTYPIGLIRLLKNINPDVVLCEGESFFLGYVKTFLYRYFYNRNLGIMHWCYISLPGITEKKTSIKYIVKNYFRNKFDACVLYSSYSLKKYIQFGQKAEKGFVATNVGNTDEFLKNQKSNKLSKIELRQKLNLPNTFISLFVGNLNKQKNPLLLLDIFENLEDEEFTLIIIGSGELEENMRKEIIRRNIKNVKMLGQKSNDLYKYYLASDNFILPGLGGMVISEALVSGLPVIMHRSDGVESDLIVDHKTGFRLEDNNFKTFTNKIIYLKDRPNIVKKMSEECRNLIINKFNTQNMVANILDAAEFSLVNRKKIVKDKQ